MSIRRSPSIAMSVVAFAVLAMATSANAATRFAEPNGNGAAGAGQCLEADPCSLVDAVENAAVVDGDEVILLPGRPAAYTRTRPRSSTSPTRSRCAAATPTPSR